MKTFLAFWKKDIINKLIVIVLLGLVGAVTGFAWLILNMPQGRSLSQAFADFLPAKTEAIPTFDINTYLTPNGSLPAPQTVTAIPTFPPTSTFPPPTPTVELIVTPTLEVLPTPALTLSTQADQPTAQSAPSDISCIPNHSPQTGKVVEILDGNTVRILIDKLVYVVRYTGVAAPENKTYAAAAKAENSKLVYGKEVSLITDISDKDDRGRFCAMFFKAIHLSI